MRRKVVIDFCPFITNSLDSSCPQEFTFRSNGIKKQNRSGILNKHNPNNFGRWQIFHPEVEKFLNLSAIVWLHLINAFQLFAPSDPISAKLSLLLDDYVKNIYGSVAEVKEKYFRQLGRTTQVQIPLATKISSNW